MQSETPNMDENLEERIHELILTPKEIKKGSTGFYSDHLLAKYLFQISDDEDTCRIPILSWNILNPKRPNGFYSKTGTREKPEQLLARYELIVQAIDLAIHAHDIPIVVLQDVYGEKFKDILQQQLGNHWQINLSKSSLLMAYDSKVLTTTANCFNQRDYQECGFNYSDVEFTLINIHFDRNEFPNGAEHRLQELFDSKDKNKNVIVVGDTSCGVAAVSYTKPTNIVKSSIPLIFNKGHQVAGFTEGAFISDRENVISQVDGAILDYHTGMPYEPDSKKTLSIKVNLDYQMIVCIDKSYKRDPIIDDKSIFQFEKELLSVEKSIIVRVAVNSMNERAIGIRFSNDSELYNSVKEKLEATEGFQFREVHGNVDPFEFQCMFCTMDQVELLCSTINTVIERSNSVETQVKGGIFNSGQGNSKPKGVDSDFGASPRDPTGCCAVS